MRKYLSFKAIGEAWVRFFETPRSPEPLGFFRIAISIFCIVQAALWHPDWEAFFGQYGWIQWEISRALCNPWELHMEHVCHFFGQFGFTEAQSLEIFFWIYVGALLGVAVGFLTRIWAIVAWLCHAIMLATMPTFFYGVDIFAHISLFYLAVMPASKAYSLDRTLGWVSGEATWGVRLSIRVLQLHLCAAYLSAGYEKMPTPEWWDGHIIWFTFTHSFFKQYDMSWLAHYPFIPMFLGWWTMFIEFGYFIGMWIPRLRVFWLVNMIALHIGIGIFVGLWLFAIIMILLSLSAFGADCLADIRAWQAKRKGHAEAPPPPLSTELVT